MSLAYEPTRSSDPDYIEKVLLARRTPMGVKILEGPRLFDLNCSQERLSIRSQFPDFSDNQVEDELRSRLAAIRKAEEEGIYFDAGVLDSEDCPDAC